MAALQEERFDSALLMIAQQSQGIEPLLDAVFSFLRRKTDFFTGAPPEMIAEKVMAAVKKQSDLADVTKSEKNKKRTQEDKKMEAARKAAALKAKEQEAINKAKALKKNEEVTKLKEAKKAKKTVSEPVEVGSDGAFDMDAADEKEVIEKEEEAAEAVDEEEEDKIPPPVGNGMVMEKYTWSQQLADLQIVVPVPEGTKTKQLKVDMTSSKLSVGMKGQEPILAGKFHKKILLDDSFWTLEDNKEVVFTLLKANQMEWWKCVVEGEPEIDTTKVNPENSKLGDLDGETRQTVEKMMYDQRQKAMGLPSADEQQKNEVLQKFMKEHPEMDFSQAKIS
mmetsp:Transcript_6439/g.7827  ORF Transcript_6439/g.7827 Transcript_6439/m.7827 type:complete len:336 (-) Transcript_6439:264-1271(-)